VRKSQPTAQPSNPGSRGRASNPTTPSIAEVTNRRRPTIVSIGYEQRTLDELIALLRTHDVDVLVDVRLNPISRRQGFSKTSLAQALDAAGIEYRHERELGNPRDNRDGFRRGLKSAHSRYARHLQNGASEVYREVVELVHTVRPALLCVERDFQECHRSSILETARADIPNLRIIEV
jgi:uncharacterized protein (DUF488 family)